MLKKTASMLCTGSVLLLLSVPAVNADEVKLIEAEGQISLGDDTTIGQAKAAALNNARRAALEKATGIVVHGSSMVYNNQLVNDLVMAATKGVIVDEKILENKCDAKDGQLFCSARIQAKVKPLSLERRGNFAVTKVTVQRPEREDSAKSAVFQSKDEIRIRTAVNEEAYVNIFSVDQNGGVSKIYPNKYTDQKTLPAGKELAFPDDNQRKMGLKLKVKTPKGVQRAVESVLVIATREKVKLLQETIENPTITDLMRELSEMDPSGWVDQTEGYEVRE